MCSIVQQLQALATSEKNKQQKKIYNAIIDELLPYAEIEYTMQFDFIQLYKLLRSLLFGIKQDGKDLLNELLLHK